MSTGFRGFPSMMRNGGNNPCTLKEAVSGFFFVPLGSENQEPFPPFDETPA